MAEAPLIDAENLFRQPGPPHFAFIENLAAVYAERFLSGLFASAVTPVALVAIGDLATTDETRARRLTFISLAGIAGFLLGPMLGVASLNPLRAYFLSAARPGRWPSRWRGPRF